MRKTSSQKVKYAIFILNTIQHEEHINHENKILCQI